MEQNTSLDHTYFVPLPKSFSAKQVRQNTFYTTEQEASMFEFEPCSVNIANVSRDSYTIKHHSTLNQRIH